MHKLVGVGLALFAGPAFADGEHEHRGLFLRMNAGLGFMSMEADDADLNLDGAALGFGGAVGGAVASNLILFGELLTVVTEPGSEESIPGGDRVKHTAIGAIGPGLAYYFMPINLHVGATLVLAVASVGTEEGDGDRRDRQTEAGPGLSLTVGRDWWISSNWGLGVAARLFGSRLKDESITRDDSHWRVGTLTVLFSATYN